MSSWLKYSDKYSDTLYNNICLLDIIISDSTRISQVIPILDPQHTDHRQLTVKQYRIKQRKVIWCSEVILAYSKLCSINIELKAMEIQFNRNRLTDSVWAIPFKCVWGGKEKIFGSTPPPPLSPNIRLTSIKGTHISISFWNPVFFFKFNVNYSGKVGTTPITPIPCT